jgi:predicted RNA-binding protein YlqC (UPF0109 family)
MAAEFETADVCTLMLLLVRAMVSKPDAVRVSSTLSPSGSTIIQIKVAQGQDLGKLIGIQGRTARSLRIIFQAIAKEHGKNYLLDIDGATIDPTSGSPLDER